MAVFVTTQPINYKVMDLSISLKVVNRNLKNIFNNIQDPTLVNIGCTINN